MFIKSNMDDKQIRKIQEDVTAFLDANRLKQAIDTLGTEIDSLQDWDIRTRYNELQTAYSYMLEYMRMNMQDPDRERLYDELVGRCYMINDLIAASRESEHSTKVYSQKCRRYKTLESIDAPLAAFKENIANLEVTKMLPADECRKVTAQLQQEHERLLTQIWEAVWCSRSWTKSYAEKILDLLNDRDIELNDRATVASAIAMGALKCFEPLKATTLCALATSEETLLATRALTGLAIVLLKYDRRIRYYNEISAALDTLQENSTCMSRLQTIQIQLLRCRETQKIDRKMREEIIPAMMKNPKLSNEKFSIDILSEIEQDEDKNPEWAKWIDKDEIKGKIEEMAKWQFEGADIYMSTFSQLKNFPFFSEITNWFRPFDTNVPVIAELLPANVEGNRTLIGAICASPFFCNSDKYSFCFTFKQVPQEQRDMLMGQIPDEGEIRANEDTLNAAVAKERRAETESNQYIQDLYRFFKLSNYRHEFSDPFATSLNMLESHSLSKLINNNGAILRTFRYLVEKEYYSEAYNAGRLYEKSGEGDAQFYQEIGFCMQKERNYNAAIDYYTRADIIKPDTLWTLRHIAQCYRMQGELEKALGYYQIAEELAPENISLLLQTGESFAATKRYEEAFARFYKAEFLKPDSRRALRAIAWCSFVTGKDEQAQGYYRRLLDMPKPGFEDYLNAAHVEWVSGNKGKAIELYSKAKECGKSTDEIAEQIMRDSDTLRARGISEKELLLLRDMLY